MVVGRVVSEGRQIDWRRRRTLGRAGRAVPRMLTHPVCTSGERRRRGPVFDMGSAFRVALYRSRYRFRSGRPGAAAECLSISLLGVRLSLAMLPQQIPVISGISLQKNPLCNYASIRFSAYERQLSILGRAEKCIPSINVSRSRACTILMKLPRYKAAGNVTRRPIGSRRRPQPLAAYADTSVMAL